MRRARGGLCVFWSIGVFRIATIVASNGDGRAVSGESFGDRLARARVSLSVSTVIMQRLR